MNHSGSGEKKGRIFGNLPKNIVSMGWASFFMGVSSEIIYPLFSHLLDFGFRFGIGLLGILTALSSGLIFLPPERLGEFPKRGAR